MSAILLALGLSLLGAPQARPQDKKAKADQLRVDAAIRKGIEYLQKAKPAVPEHRRGKPGDMCDDELVLWTFVHAGVPESDPLFQQLFKSMMETELQRTYCVALQAMILEELDRVKYQGRILQCAQFLVDNQCKNGQWKYGAPSPFAGEVKLPKDVATGGDKKAPARKPASGAKGKPPVRARIPVVQRRGGEEEGDNSNSQYAALGLRACHEAGAILPAEVIDLATAWWRKNQHEASNKDGYPAAGWGYGDGGPYGSMTAGAVGSLVIYDHIKSGPHSWLKDKDVQEGLQWLALNYSVTTNPLHAEPRKHHHYFLYALERVGLLYGTERLGGHEWYPEGAKVLVESQKPDGGWEASLEATPIHDTCFAILFLRRATRPLVDVPSVDRFIPRSNEAPK